MTTEGLPELPIVGIQEDGWILTDTSIEPIADEEDGQTATSVTFRGAGTLAGPLISVAVEATFGEETPIESGGDPVDLDGDGSDDGITHSTPSGGLVVLWTDEDGRAVSVGGYGLGEAAVVDYASTLHGGDLDPTSIPAPEGLPDRSVATVPSGLGSEQAIATYRNGNKQLLVTTTNEPGWFDVLETYGSSTYSVFEEAAVGETFLGPAQAIVSEPRRGYGYALVVTASGLTISIASDGGPTSASELRDLLTAGRLIELDPDLLGAPPTSTTTVDMAVTTLPQTTTSIPVGDVYEGVPTFDREHSGTGTSIAITFGDDPIEYVEPPADTAEQPPSCSYRPDRGFDRYFIVDVMFSASEDGALVYDEDGLALWWCAEAEATLLVVGHGADVTPTARAQGSTVVVEVPGPR
jgi:hypothetical protein